MIQKLRIDAPVFHRSRWSPAAPLGRTVAVQAVFAAWVAKGEPARLTAQATAQGSNHPGAHENGYD